MPATGHLVTQGHEGELYRVSGFLHVPDLGIGNEPGQWYTTGKTEYYCARLDRRFTVPPYFIHDLASIPKLFHNLISDDGYERGAAVLHDWLCVTAAIDRSDADLVFRDACYVAGCSWWKIQAMYAAVRCYSLTFGRNQTTNRAQEDPGAHFINPDAEPIANRRAIRVLA